MANVRNVNQSPSPPSSPPLIQDVLSSSDSFRAFAHIRTLDSKFPSDPWVGGGPLWCSSRRRSRGRRRRRSWRRRRRREEEKKEEEEKRTSTAGSCCRCAYWRASERRRGVRLPHGGLCCRLSLCTACRADRRAQLLMRCGTLCVLPATRRPLPRRRLPCCWPRCICPPPIWTTRWRAGSSAPRRPGRLVC